MPKMISKLETKSTNVDAKELAREGCEPFTSIWAHRQTHGRGQRGRQWRSEEGSVFWSIVLRPDGKWHNHENLIYVTSLAVIGALETLIGNDAELSVKWPNDTILRGGKLGGTLTEASGPRRYGPPDWVVSGTGINVVPISDDPSMIYPPTSLHQSGYTAITRDKILPLLTEYVVKEVEEWTRTGFGAVRERWLASAFGLNTRLKFNIPIDGKTVVIEGVFRGIDTEGALLVEDDAGEINTYRSGEVIRWESPSD